MAAARSHRFNPNLDPELLASMEAAAGAYKPYKVELRSGYRPGDPRQHGKGEALDVQLYDPKTGAPLDSYQRGGQISPYQQFANSWYQSLSPEQQKKARWGGYFGDPSSAGYGTKYGTQDFMHFDFGRTPELGMLAGDWGTGYNEAAMKALGLKESGGIDPGTVSAVAQATGMSEDQVKAAFLSTVAGTEAPGYNALYGGGDFGDDYSAHPNRKIPIMSGPNKGDYSTAAGRYQFLNSTWADEQKKLGLTDFSPKSQDAAAWDLANTTYSNATKGASLMEALQSGDPARINAAAQLLHGQWTSLPGGIEQGKGYGTSTFADAYNKHLNAKGEQFGPPMSAKGGGEQFGPPMSAAPAKKPSMWEAFGKGLGGMAGGGQAQGGGQQMPGTPAAALAVEAAAPMVDVQGQEQQRQQLAQAMAALTSRPGRLWG